MKNGKLFLVDMRFNSRGHYVDDLKQFEFLSEQYDCFYLAPTDEKVIDTSKFNYIGSRRYFLFKVFKILLLDRKSKVVFLSCSYLPLFVLSVLSFNFNYYYRIHSFPAVRRIVYRPVIKFMSRLSRCAIFLDYPVRDFFVSNGLVFPEKAACVIGRPVDFKSSLATSSRKDDAGSFHLMFIGAMNAEKDLNPVLDALLSVKVNGIRLSFYSSGIAIYEDKLNSIKRLYPDTVVSDKFLSRSEYDQKISSCDALILPYKKSYGVRFSAVLNDALRMGKKVLTVRLPQFEYYSKNYNACFMYKDADDVVNAISELKKSPPIDFFRLVQDYNKRVQIQQIRSIGI